MSITKRFHTRKGIKYSRFCSPNPAPDATIYPIHFKSFDWDEKIILPNISYNKIVAGNKDGQTPEGYKKIFDFFMRHPTSYRKIISFILMKQMMSEDGKNTKISMDEIRNFSRISEFDFEHIIFYLCKKVGLMRERSNQEWRIPRYVWDNYNAVGMSLLDELKAAQFKEEHNLKRIKKISYDLLTEEELKEIEKRIKKRKDYTKAKKERYELRKALAKTTEKQPVVDNTSEPAK